MQISFTVLHSDDAWEIFTLHLLLVICANFSKVKSFLGHSMEIAIPSGVNDACTDETM